MSLRISAPFSSLLAFAIMGALPLLVPYAAPAQTPGAHQPAKKTDANEDSDPTASLFQAINKGDSQGVQDALNRGADTNAHNVLDQSPLDMAIDLNRYDIAFVLLSMRTYNEENTQMAANASSNRPQTSTEIKIKPEAKTSKVHKVSHRYATTHGLPSGRSSYDQTGGAAQPSVGFLGFGK